MITAEEIITTQGRHAERKKFASSDVYKNAADLADRIGKLSGAYGSNTFVLNSGFRDPKSNAEQGGALNSQHIFGRAVDIDDPHGDLALWCALNPDLLKHFGLFMEHPEWTRKRVQGKSGWPIRWVHLQSKAPPSGLTIFEPGGMKPR